MSKFFKKVYDNSIFSLISNLIYKLIFIFIFIMLVIVILQKISDNRLSLFGYRMFTIVTASMAPKYEIGDVLLAKNVDLSTLNVGDDIAYIGVKGDFKDRVITHQVVSINEENGKYTFTTKGTLNNEEDPEVAGEQIYGKIIYKFQILSIFCKLIRNIYAFYFIVFVPIGLIIFDQVRNLLRKDDTEDEEDTTENDENSNEGESKKDENKVENMLEEDENSKEKENAKENDETETEKKEEDFKERTD